MIGFQSGLLRLDGRAAGPEDLTPALPGVAPVSHRQGELLLAHTASIYLGRNCAATFDGRLDNGHDLRERLHSALLEDTSDAALAVAAWQQWGIQGLSHLIGDWSLVIWDSTQKTILLASDFAGVRPLYYTTVPGRALWSTRLLALVDCAGAFELDDEYVAGFLTSGGCPNRTPYGGILSVPPGHAVCISAGGTTIVPFWKLPLTGTIRYPREPEYEDHLLALFREAVQCRVPDAASCLCDLSGGLDSSSVVCMAADMIRAGGVKPERFATITLEHEGSRDAPFYTAVERHCGLDAIHLSPLSHPFLTRTDTGGAQPGFWEALQKHVAGMARDAGITTYLTGKLGDEVMGNWADDSDQVAGLLRRGNIGAALSQSLAWSKRLRVPVFWILWRAIRSNMPPPLTATNERALTAWTEGPRDEENSIAPAFWKKHDLADPNRFFPPEWMAARPERRRRLRNLTIALGLRRLQTPEVFEHLDYTHPFLHRPLVSFMLSTPADVICRPGEPRRLMRRAFQHLWPAELRGRSSKDTFGGVFLDSLRPLAHELLKQDQPLQLVERGYVDRESLRRRLERLTMSMKCNESQLRNLILLELWLRSFPGSRFVYSPTGRCPW